MSGVCSHTCPLGWRCSLTILSSVTPFFFFLQSFSASGSFPVSQFFTSGGKNIGASASATVLPMNIQGWFPLGLTGLILQYKRLSRVFLSTIIQIISLVLSLLYGPSLTSIHGYLKNHSFDFVKKVMSLLFNMRCTLVIDFLPSSKCLLISWLLSQSAVILEPRKIKSVTASTFPPSICTEVMRLNAIILVFWMLFQTNFFTLLFYPHQEAF